MMPERRAVNDRVFNALTQDELLTARSMVIAVDAIEGKSRYTEMAYMWKDAIDKNAKRKRMSGRKSNASSTASYRPTLPTTFIGDRSS